MSAATDGSARAFRAKASAAGVTSYAAFELEGELYRGEVAVVVLALCVAAGAGARQQAEGLPVAQHARGGAQLLGGLSDAHAANLDISVSEIGLPGDQTAWLGPLGSGRQEAITVFRGAEPG